MKRGSSVEKPVVDLAEIRKELNLSQTELAALLAVSPRTVQSCEQGWRMPSASLEKAALLLLLSARNGSGFMDSCCWEMTSCPSELRQECLAHSSGQGHLCWFLTGTFCHGQRLGSWSEKISFCIECSFFKVLVKGDLPLRHSNQVPSTASDSRKKEGR